MGQTTDQIAAHIEDTRDHLGSNLQELEQKVKSVTDWKQHFRTNPMTTVSAAFGGGILLAILLGGRKSRRTQRFSSHSTGAEPPPRMDQQKHQALETWDNIKGALIGVAATRFKDFVDDIVPGFREQFERTEQRSRQNHA